MKIYRVGGSVRDELLGRPLADRDYVVVGATPEEMLARGFRPVGREFPVFLHPETKEEYALARTERKKGRGHRAFTFHAAPDVTLEQDLARRDLTINAMARDADGRLIDPYGGAADLQRRMLRHVGPAFVEDPLRVLRVARFAARFGFGVAPETEALLRRVAASGELATLSPERVWQESSRALLEAHPSRFFALLHRWGALGQLMPEVDRVFAGRARSRAGTEVGSSVPVLRAVDAAAAQGESLAVRYAVLAGSLAGWARRGRRASPAQGPRLAAALNQRLKAPTECAALALLMARHRSRIERAAELPPPELLDLLLSVDALRRPLRLEQLLRACALDWSARSGRAETSYAPARHLRAALEVVRGVNAAAISDSAPRADVPQRLRAARLKALREWDVRRSQPVRRNASSRK